MKTQFLISLTATLMATAAPAWSAVLAEQLPRLQNTGQSQQSDTGTTAVEVDVSLPTPSFVSSITWWGYHGSGSISQPADDTFDIWLGGTQLGTTASPSFTLRTPVATNNNPDVFRYTATLDSQFLVQASTTLAIQNTNEDAYWIWRGAQGSPAASPWVAYRINGVAAPVPEPAAWMMLALGLIALGLVKRQQRGS